MRFQRSRWLALALAGGAAAAEPELPERSTREGRHVLSAAYLGYNFNWPGAEVGYSYRAIESPLRRHALVVGADVGVWVWPRHDIGVFVTPKLGWRGRHRVGLEGSLDMRVGYLHSMTASESFSVQDGVVVSDGRVGYPMLIASPQVGVGWFFDTVGVAPFVRAGVIVQHPNFDATLLRFHVTAGVEVRL
jgi:hypothetical protein